MEKLNVLEQLNNRSCDKKSKVPIPSGGDTDNTPSVHVFSSGLNFKDKVEFNDEDESNSFAGGNNELGENDDEGIENRELGENDEEDRESRGLGENDDEDRESRELGENDNEGRESRGLGENDDEDRESRESGENDDNGRERRGLGENGEVEKIPLGETINKETENKIAQVGTEASVADNTLTNIPEIPDKNETVDIKESEELQNLLRMKQEKADLKILMEEEKKSKQINNIAASKNSSDDSQRPLLVNQNTTSSEAWRVYGGAYDANSSLSNQAPTHFHGAIGQVYGGTFKYHYDFELDTYRRVFLWKMFLILTLQFAWCIFMICLLVLHENSQYFMATNSWWTPMVFLLFISLYIAIVCMDINCREWPINLVVFCVFTLMLSLLFASVAARYDVYGVIISFCLTFLCLMFITLFTVVFNTKFDFTSALGTFSILALYIGAYIIAFFRYVPQLYYEDNMSEVHWRYFFMGVGTFIFLVWVAYDTQMIVGGRSGGYIRADEHMYAALSIYIDIIGFFHYILYHFNYLTGE